MDQVGDGGAWGDWLRTLGSQVVNTVSQIEVMKTAQVGSVGLYREGQFGAVTAAGGIPSGFLLIGAGVLAFVLLKG
jgi:hypothetical protein